MDNEIVVSVFVDAVVAVELLVRLLLVLFIAGIVVVAAAFSISP